MSVRIEMGLTLAIVSLQLLSSRRRVGAGGHQWERGIGNCSLELVLKEQGGARDRDPAQERDKEKTCLRRELRN